tara:strand:+ start:516 stop:1889 length:1374 start_codon:yes stop_codon:yes gene_type:complete
MDKKSISSKKKDELIKLCQDNKQLYKGYSKCKKKEELVDFILSKGPPVNQQLEASVSNVSNSLENMFQDQDEYINRMFRARPPREDIDKVVSDIETHIKLNNSENSVVFDIHDDHESDYTYRLFKHKFYKKYGDLGEHGEMILFHGTDKCNIQGILNDDFSLTVSATHGYKHGRGIYFTNCIDKALYYSERGNDEKYVFICLVHVGDTMIGRMNTDLHPKIPGSSIGKTYDTSVDKLVNPKQFVKKKNGCYNILGIMKFNLNPIVTNSRYLTGGATGQSNTQQSNIPELKIGTQVEIITKRLFRSPTTGDKESLYQKKAVIDSNRFTSGNIGNQYRIVLDGSYDPSLTKAQRTFTISESLIKRVDNIPNKTPSTLSSRLRVTNSTDDLIKLYWVPNHIDIYDPTLDIRQHGKFMGNIEKGCTSAFRTNMGDKFMCANNIGYIRIIEINNKYDDVIVS